MKRSTTASDTDRESDTASGVGEEGIVTASAPRARNRGIVIGVALAFFLFALGPERSPESSPTSEVEPRRLGTLESPQGSLRPPLDDDSGPTNDAARPAVGGGPQTRRILVPRTRLIFSTECVVRVVSCAAQWGRGITIDYRTRAPLYSWHPVAAVCGAREESGQSADSAVWSSPWLSTIEVAFRGDSLTREVAARVLQQAFKGAELLRSAAADALSKANASKELAHERRFHRARGSILGDERRRELTVSFRFDATLRRQLRSAQVGFDECREAPSAVGDRLLIVSFGLHEAEEVVVDRNERFADVARAVEHKLKHLLTVWWDTPCVGAVIVLDQTIDCEKLKQDIASSRVKRTYSKWVDRCGPIREFLAGVTAAFRRLVGTRAEWYGTDKAALQLAASFRRGGVVSDVTVEAGDGDDPSATVRPLLPHGHRAAKTVPREAQRRQAATLGGGQALPVDDLDESDVQKSPVELTPTLFLPPLPCADFSAAISCTSGPTCAACTRDGIHLLSPWQDVQTFALRSIVASLSDCVSSQV